MITELTALFLCNKLQFSTVVTKIQYIGIAIMFSTKLNAEIFILKPKCMNDIEITEVILTCK